MDCVAALAMTKYKRPGSLPAFLVFYSSCPALCRASTSYSANKKSRGWPGPKQSFVASPAMTIFRSQFNEARLGGVAGHDLISAS